MRNLENESSVTLERLQIANAKSTTHALERLKHKGRVCRIGVLRCIRHLRDEYQIILDGCQRNGLKVCDFVSMGQSAFHVNAFRKMFSKNNADDVEPRVISLLNENNLICIGLDFFELTSIISSLYCT